MRLSVASTGGATGSGSAGDAARFSAVYSLTGSTTQPSAGGDPDDVLCAELETAQQMTNSVVESRKRDTGKRSRFIVILLCNFVCSTSGHTSRHCGMVAARKLARTFVRGEIGA